MTLLSPPPRATLALLACAAACSGATDIPDGDPTLSATIDGSAWSARRDATGASGGANGVFAVVGGDASGRVLSLTVYNIGAPGTYPLGVGASVFGGTATIFEDASSWWTPLSGAAGSVTITHVSQDRLAGSFAFTAVPLLGGASSPRSVTGGSFDVAVNASDPVTVPPNVGSRFGGTLGGASWNAATIVMIQAPGTGTLASGFSNDTHQISLVLSGFTGAGQYDLGTVTARHFGVTNLDTGKKWGGTEATNSGSITVSAIDANRVQGSYDVTLQPGSVNPGTGNLTLTGTFDLGIS